MPEASTPALARPSSSLPTDLLEAQRDIWYNCLSKDTLAGYRSKKAKWLTFCMLFRRTPADLSPSNIIDYLTYLGTVGRRNGTPLAYASIKAYVDFLGRAHSYTSPHLPNPVHHPEVELFLRGLARTLGKAVTKAEPCSLEHLRALNQYAEGHRSESEAQTVALLATIAFWGCLRLGALIPKAPEKKLRILTFGDLTLSGSTLLITVRASKTIQYGERVHRIELPSQDDPLLCPLRALRRWTSLWRHLSYQTPLCALSTTSTAMLSASRFLSLVNRVTRPASLLTGHSFRRGFVRLAFLTGVPIWELMHHGDWKTVEVCMSYAEGVLIRNPLAARLRRPIL